jgi:hypothetical protein
MNKKINRSERPGISPVDSTGIRTIHQGCIEQDFKELAVYCPLVPSSNCVSQRPLGREAVGLPRAEDGIDDG